MMQLIDKQGALDLNKELIEKNLMTVKDGFLRHPEMTGDIAEEMVGKIISKYPGIKERMRPEEVAVSGYLHEIGRVLQEEQLFHELRGAQYIEEHGLEKGVADTYEAVNRIAQMCRSHGFGYYMFIDPANAEAREEFKLIPSFALVPRTWQEAIMTVADLSNAHGERISVEDCLAETLRRYENDPKYKDERVVRSIETGRNRILELSERVKALVAGKLSEMDMTMKYGFNPHKFC
ncbi:MAG: hypothetical protein KAT77_03840 [Nanoarchaeota archaeon]|nr:hypothetical protein [Nanoarchaeota archaeon]